MHYQKEEIQKSYDKYLDAEKNQEEIFALLRLALDALVNLASFNGDGAVAIKNYLEDIHMGVLDTFGIALMELEIHFLELKQSFEGSVDDSCVAILDSQFINGKKGDLNGHRTNMETINVAAEDAVSKIKNDVALKSLPYQDCVTSFNTLSNKIDAVLDSMGTFNSQHLADLDNFYRVFPLLDQAFSFMDGVIKPGGSTYSRVDAMNLPWLNAMSDYRVSAFLYAREADPNLYQTFYLAVLVNCGFDVLEYAIVPGVDINQIYQWLRNGGNDAMGYFSDASDATNSLWEMIRLLRSGLKFTVTADKDSAVFIKITTRGGEVLSAAERLKALKLAEAPIPSDARTLSRLFDSDKGLCVWGKSKYSSTLFGSAFSDAESSKAAVKLAEAIRIGDFSEAGSLSKVSKILRGVDRVGKVIGTVGYVFTAGLDVADSFYDKRTDELTGSFNGARLAAGGILDGSVILAAVGAGAAAGSEVPIIGNLVGAGVGLVIGVVGSVVQWGEPKKSLFDHAKDGLTDVCEDVGNWFKKVFG